MGFLRLLLLLPAFTLWLAPAGAGEGPSVVASIRPVHSLVAGVMDGVGEPYLLVRGGGSPHAYAMRPSDARALDQAQIVFWIGEAMETFLARPIEVLAGDADAAPFARAQGIRLLARRAESAWDGHGPDGHDGHDAGPEDPGRSDMHLWLDPENAIAMVEDIAARLVVADPDRAQIYTANAARIARQLSALDRELAETLTPLQDKPYIVFHDAYQYLEARYGLTSVGSMTDNAEQGPGAGRLSRIRERLGISGALCVFAEPQFEPGLVDTLASGTGAQAAVLDPLGAGLPAGAELYADLMRAMAASLVACLLR
jgi:zinc transport system substrate-binding protein